MRPLLCYTASERGVFMAVWLCRAGRLGEYEARFLEDGKIFYTFEEVNCPLTDFPSKKELQAFFLSLPSPAKENAVRVYAGQGFAFCREMAVGDLVVTPSKTAPGILRFGEITGGYEYIPDAAESYRHARSVKWFADLNRSLFDAEVLSSLGALMTICKVKHEDRIRKIVNNYKENEMVNFTPPPEKSGSRIIGRYFRLPSPQFQGAWPCPCN